MPSDPLPLDNPSTAVDQSGAKQCALHVWCQLLPRADMAMKYAGAMLVENDDLTRVRIDTYSS